MPKLSIAERELADANCIQAAAALKVAVLRSATLQARGGVRPEAVPSLPTTRSIAQTPIALTDGAFDGDDSACVFVVDHDAPARSALRCLLEANGLRVEVFANAAAFVSDQISSVSTGAARTGRSRCVVTRSRDHPHCSSASSSAFCRPLSRVAPVARLS